MIPIVSITSTTKKRSKRQRFQINSSKYLILLNSNKIEGNS